MTNTILYIRKFQGTVLQYNNMQSLYIDEGCIPYSFPLDGVIEGSLKRINHFKLRHYILNWHICYKNVLTSHRSDKLACSRAACRLHYLHIPHYPPNSHTIDFRLGKRVDCRSRTISGIALSFAVGLWCTTPILPNWDSWELRHPNTCRLDRSREAD